MEHLKPENLQLYLAGETDLAESARIEEHLTRCAQCESLLATVAAEDGALTEALALTADEAAWVAAQDLRPAVTRRIAPWFLQPQGLLLLLSLVATAGWMLQQTVDFVSRWMEISGPIGLTVGFMEGAARLAWAFLTYMGAGGPVAALTPLVLVLLAAAVIRRRKNSNA